MKGEDPFVEGGHLFSIDVNSDDVMAKIGHASGMGDTEVSSADHGEAHRCEVTDLPHASVAVIGSVRFVRSLIKGPQ